MQAFLFGNPNRDKLNLGIQKLNGILAQLKKGQSSGYFVVGPLKHSYKKAVEIKARAKLVVLVDWTLDNILNDRKEGPALKQQSEMITTTVARMNVMLPDYLLALLAKMDEAS